MDINKKLLPLGIITNDNALEYVKLIKSYSVYEREWVLCGLIDSYTEEELTQANLVTLLGVYRQSLTSVMNNCDNHSELDLYVTDKNMVRLYVKANESKDNVKLYADAAGHIFSDFHKAKNAPVVRVNPVEHFVIHTQPYGFDKFVNDSYSEFYPINLRELKIDSLFN